MPWVRAMLRGQTVWARALESGALATESGRVEIRYKPNDGRFYRALAANLDVLPGAALPDDACGPAEAPLETPAAPKKAAAPAKRGAAKKVASRAAQAEGSESVPEAAAGEIVFYADGACTGNPGPAGLGVFAAAGHACEISEYLGHGTNNIAELTAVLRALEVLEQLGHQGRARILTDSQYSIGVLQKGWRAKANQELVGEIKRRLQSKRGVVLGYVPGHAGVAGNERADELAREAVRARRSRRVGC